MSRYIVYYTATASSYIEVDAPDKDEAREIAEEEFSQPGICAQCSGWGKDYGIDLSEWQQGEDEEDVREVSA